MNTQQSETCCPRFDPGPWDGKELQWIDRPFVKDHVISFLHVPLNFGSVMRRNVGPIEAAGAMPENMVVLSDESSLWGADVYLEVTKDVPGAELVKFSGTYLSKVFEGPFRDMGKWIAEMNSFVKRRGKEPRRLFTYYTTCPRCAKKYGKNYVAILAQVSPD